MRGQLASAIRDHETEVQLLKEKHQILFKNMEEMEGSEINTLQQCIDQLREANQQKDISLDQLMRKTAERERGLREEVEREKKLGREKERETESLQQQLERKEKYWREENQKARQKVRI